jgi:hypothetical protein
MMRPDPAVPAPVQQREGECEMRSLRAVLVAMAATALIAGAGCGGGGDGNQQYADDVSAVLEPLGTDLQQIGEDVTGSAGAQQLADSVGKAEDEIRGAIDELKAIDPPSEVEDAHQALTSALDTFNAALGKLSDAAASGDPAQILSAATTLPAAVGALQTSLESVKAQLEDAGIDVSG